MQKAIITAVGLLAVAALHSPATPFSFDSVDVQRQIADNTTTVSILDATSSDLINDLNVFVDLDHSWVGDLRISIRHENTGTEVVLFNRAGGFFQDIRKVTFDDQASVSFTDPSLTPTFGPGSFRPQSGNLSLSSFDGESLNGAWTLTIEDLEVGYNGRLRSWSLRGDASAPSVPDAGSTLSLFLLGILPCAVAGHFLRRAKRLS
ncbi:MAG: hypothetical protein JWM16_3715 [Verrucomicrobiales bacterium]|nr:hypothetical protein [Verrucomicrobiales bacterium]